MENTYLGIKPSEMSRERLLDLVHGLEKKYSEANKSALAGSEIVKILETKKGFGLEIEEVRELLEKYNAEE